VTLTIPGPKMIWHFAELGMENSIFTCSDGSFNDPDCKLSTKPQPQWMNNWLSDPNRNQIYNAWSRINNLKINEPVFEGDYAIDSGTLTPRIYVFDNSIPANELRNVVILANFDVVAQNVTPDFPYTGTWYDLMDESGSSSINVSNTTTPINIPPGEFRMYGNALPETLSSDDFELNQDFKIYPNPTFDTFQINRDIDSIDIYDLTGKLIKTFEGGFSSTSVFDISGLSQSVYILKAKDNTGGQITAKIVKL
ncbi:MAG: T9SS type A sorting domain-containing protein, partial [Bacteroidia bacterium]|nr:T9SS type A sorting domain-containing protein [Bacteroidia bacterium]